MSDAPRLHSIVDSFADRTVAVCGDLVLDRFITGVPKRISREAPVIILRFREQHDVPGGGANALANVAALGGTAIPVGVVGDDEPGRGLLALLHARGIATDHVLIRSDYHTPTKVRLLAGGPGASLHQVARYDVEDELGADGAWRGTFRLALAEAARRADAIAVSDYGYGLIGHAEIAALTSSRRAAVPIVADSRFGLTGLGQVDGATPNIEELAEFARRPLAGDDDVAQAAEDLRRHLDAAFVLATRGSHGMTLVEGGGPVTHLGVFGSDQVADVTGAGDTVIATLTLALAAHATPLEAATLANLAGGIVVMKMGTAVATAEELHRAIDLVATDA